MKSILNPSFKYTPASLSTPERLRAKFRKLIAEQQAARQANATKVAPIKTAVKR